MLKQKKRLEAITKKQVNSDVKGDQVPVFARAVKNFAQKLGKTLPKVRTQRFKEEEDPL